MGDFNDSSSNYIVNFCKSCGADVRLVSRDDWNNNVCPYCGREIYDHSQDINDAKIREVEKAGKKLSKLPLKIAITILGTVFITFVGIAIYYMSGLNYTLEYKAATAGSDVYTKKMEKCYKKQDWDGLYDLVITNCEKSINSPYYFTYRTAWFMSCFPEQFDSAYAEGDVARMKEIFEIIEEDYNLRQHDFDSLYKSVDEIEKSLVKEYERERSMMDEVR